MSDDDSLDKANDDFFAMAERCKRLLLEKKELSSKLDVAQKSIDKQADLISEQDGKLDALETRLYCPAPKCDWRENP
jgi:hypothetical protein